MSSLPRPTGDFRARRPASPPPNQPYPPAPAPRFPHRDPEYLDADERRAAARLDTSGRLRKSYPLGGLKLTSGEWKILLVIVVIACAVRLYRLSSPNSVVFDEVHFGKFAARYLMTRYYVDVHPPLAKLLITLAAFVGRFDAKFDFKEIGKIYENVPYVTMRMVPATLGVALVPLTYLTLRALDCRATTAILGSVFVTFENGLITQSRHILLDSPLVFFTGLSVFSFVCFTNEDKDKARQFTDTWWGWLTLTGLSLGAVVSCKWVGLFTIATIGVATIFQLWNLLGDLRVPPKLFLKHFYARALCLIVVPIIFYMAMFEIHFLILENSGEGDGFMSSEFQHTLGGRGMEDTFADVALGSDITIRHLNTQGGYLHSHPHNYPGGSNQQQITLYPHRDNNNNWRIVNSTRDDAPEFDWNNSEPVFITNNMMIRLQHIATEKRLHSHDVRPPVSEVDFQNEVSGYGFPGFSGDANDNFVVEIEYGDKKDKASWKRLRTLRTKFRLRHVMTGCYLFSHKVKLPEWGFEQQEVTCNKNAVKPNSLWYVETNTHPRLRENAEKVNYRLPGFLSKFLELQKVMWTTNAGLTERHAFDSRPSAWPLLQRGINFWVKDHKQIYLIGNPIVWWLSTASVLSYFLVRGILILRAKRGYKDFNHSVVVKYDQLCGFLVIGWFLHYFPFYLMQRQLFLHHYFPALYFAILTSCGVFDLITSTLRPRVRLQIAAVLMIIAIWNYAHFSPLAYGNPWTKAKCNNAKWLKTWDFSCNDFLDDYSQYTPNIKASPTTPHVPVATIGGEEGGRAPIVVEVPKEEHIGKPAEEAKEETAIVDKVEPGRDVFHKESGTKSIPTLPADQDDVHTATTGGNAKAPEEPADDKVVKEPPPVDKVETQEEPKEEKKKDETKDDAKAKGDESPPAPATPEKAKGEAQGPLDAADSEAERVRQGLFPEENKA